MSREIAKAGGDPELFRQNVYWLGWRDLSLAIDQAGLDDIIVGRLRGLLDRRELSVFAGCNPPADGFAVPWNYMRYRAYIFGCPEHSALPWIYRGGATHAVGQPKAFTLQWTYREEGTNVNLEPVFR